MELQNTVITDVYGTYTVYSVKGRYEQMRERTHYGLSLCMSGLLTYIQNGREYVSDRDSAIILPKGGSYAIRGDRTGHFPVINFDCRDFLRDTVTEIRTQEAERLLNDYEKIQSLLCFNGGRAKILSIFYGMLHTLSADSIPAELTHAVQCIKNSYSDPQLTNGILARECNISEVYFRKLFAKHLGVSPKQYIINIRLQKAKQLLSEGSMKISAVSEACGFSSPYHFCREFRRHIGVSPSEYRKENLIFRI